MVGIVQVIAPAVQGIFPHRGFRETQTATSLTRDALVLTAKAPQRVQRAFDKQSLLLLQNLHHPSLRAKKYDEAQNLWQAGVTRSWRFYILIQKDVYYIVDIVPHPK